MQVNICLLLYYKHTNVLNKKKHPCRFIFI